MSSLSIAACSDNSPAAHDPDTAAVASVDRFSAQQAKLMVRTTSNGLPAANAAVDFDSGPFITQGLGPDGSTVKYYNFDVQPATPAPIYVLFVTGQSMPVTGQLNIVDVIPGEPGYSDFWRVIRVDVPADYVANSVVSFADIEAAGYALTPTPMLVNCPIVPAGSTARLRVGSGSPMLHRGWYHGDVVNYFTFEEAPLMAEVGAMAPMSPIFVTFNVNPDQPNGGPASGFVTEGGTAQTHNVLGTLPGDESYSPLWSVSVYDNVDFAHVANLSTITSAHVVARDVMDVNCPLAAR